MKHCLVVLVAVVALTLVLPFAATAETTAPAASPPAAAPDAAPAPTTLAELFGEGSCDAPAGNTEPAMTEPDPLAGAQATSCTFQECRSNCVQPGCFAHCVDFQQCLCETICP